MLSKFYLSSYFLNLRYANTKCRKEFFSLSISQRYWNDKFQPDEKRFKKILIANRGEIACRVMATCRRLGIKTVAIYSDVDSLSKHVEFADEAICVGSAPASKSYLDVEAIIHAVQLTGAEAVHPGYGFLSENTNFASRLEKLGVQFIGPNSTAIHKMGDKLESKRIAKEAGVNCIPGFDGVIPDVQTAIIKSNEIGYPVMIKASAGGGGKGMRIAWNDQEVADGYRLSKEEAASSFGDDRMLIEKYIDKPRHIEIQILGDRFGNVIHLFERECSIQRRNQKVIEEAPSTFLDPNTRDSMGKQAVQLARAVNYDSAGTVEFLVDSKRNFYFLEMNTRLQVEHPITECISGVDIVHQMLRIAANNKLLIDQPVLEKTFWAIESRVYAEDPYRNFGVPSIGRLTHYVEPTDDLISSDSYLRCDSGVQEGSEISVYYDPMICKLVTAATSRDKAIQSMIVSLDNYVINGVAHNIPLLRDIMSEKRFVTGDISTNYLNEVYPQGFVNKKLNEKELDQLASTAALIVLKSYYKKLSSRIVENEQTDLLVKTILADGVYVLIGNTTYFQYKRDAASGNLIICRFQNWSYCDSTHIFKLSSSNENLSHRNVSMSGSFDLSDHILNLSFNSNEPQVIQLLTGRSGPTDGKGHKMVLQFKGCKIPIQVWTKNSFEAMQHILEPVSGPDTSNAIIAPMPGLLKSVSVNVGDKVAEGQEVCVLEAMKMQNSLTASKVCTIKKINCNPGQTVSEGDIIIELE